MRTSRNTVRPPSPESNTRIVGAMATAATWYEKNDRRATLEHSAPRTALAVLLHHRLPDDG